MTRLGIGSKQLNSPTAPVHSPSHHHLNQPLSPHCRSSMAKPTRFPAALAASFGIMFACYSAVAAAGYWYFVSLPRPHAAGLT